MRPPLVGIRAGSAVRRTVVLGVSVLGVIGWATAAAAAAPSETGWWWYGGGIGLPAPAPAGGLWVANSVAGPLAVSAIRADLPVESTEVELRLTVEDSSGQVAALACPAASTWEQADGAAWSERPAAACTPESSSTGQLEGDTLTFDLSSLLRDGHVDVVLTPDPAATATFSITFERPGPDALRTNEPPDGEMPSPPTLPPPEPTPSPTGIAATPAPPPSLPTTTTSTPPSEIAAPAQVVPVSSFPTPAESTRSHLATAAILAGLATLGTLQARTALVAGTRRTQARVEAAG